MMAWFLYGAGIGGLAIAALLAGSPSNAAMIVGFGLIAASIVESRT